MYGHCWAGLKFLPLTYKLYETYKPPGLTHLGTPKM